jgi:hypothetical protein
MATKLETLKQDIGYSKKPYSCSNCMYFTKDTVEVKTDWTTQVFTKDTNIKCTKYNFATKVSAVCANHQLK